MKKIFQILSVLIFSCISSESFPQTYNGTFQESFFGRQPSARAEAMGKGLASVTGDPVSYFYNPAGMASLEGLNLNVNFAGPYYFLYDAGFNYYGASYKIKNYGDVGFSVDYFNYGYDVVRTDEFGNYISSYEPKITNYRLTLSSEVIKELFVGINFNLMDPNLSPDEFTVGNEKGGGNSSVFYMDLGMIKSFILESKGMKHKFNLGSSLINLTSSSYSSVDADQGDKLPVIFRIGAAYDLSLNDNSIVSKLKSYNFLLNLEYEDLFNSGYYGGFHSGLEFTFLEILSLRGGYYSMSLNDHGISSSNESSIDEFTYGFGLNIPVKQLTKGKTPVEIKFDFVNLKQPSYSKTNKDWDNFYNYTFIINWIF